MRPAKFTRPRPHGRRTRTPLGLVALEGRDCPANLIANPSVEVPADSNAPAGWRPDRWGTNAATFSYLQSGMDGQRSVRVDMTARSSGDAKWYFDDVPVTPGQTYTFSDLYTSNVLTHATLRYRMANGSFTYIGYYPAPAGTGRTLNFDFTPPANVVSATVFHVIQTPGFLVTDRFALDRTGAPAPDATAPTVSVTTPAAGAVVSGTINLAAQASDNIGVAGVRFFVDGNVVGAEDTSAPYQVAFNTDTLTPGSHTVTAVARDAAGNATTSAPVTFTVAAPADTTAPTVSVTGPAAGSTVSGTINLTAQAADNVGVAGVRFLVDGNPVESEDTAAPFQVSLDTTTLTNGSYTVTAVARDAAGNTTTSAAVTFTVANGTTPALSNLVQNPSFETVGADGNPVGWTRNSWGTNSPSYSVVPGVDGARAARVDMTSYSSGDAKWVFADVPVSPNTTYTFSDSYRSNVTSQLTIRYTLADGSQSYVWVANLPAAANWANASYQVTTPANVVSMTVFHLIFSVGWLETDKFGLTAPTGGGGGGGGTPGTGLVSFTFDDGWASQLQYAVPVLQQANLPASFYVITRINQGGGAWELVQNGSLETAAGDTGPAGWNTYRTGTNATTFNYATTGSDGTRSARVDVTSHSSGDAGWYFQDVAVQGGTRYALSHQYNATVPTSVLVRFTHHDGTVSWVDPGSVPATNGQWQTRQFTVTAPATADAMTVIHRISGVGTLWTDNYSAKPVDPYSNPSYLTPAQIQGLQAAGFEVGAHTMTHANLTALSAAGARAEIEGSRNDLLNLGITPTTFVYPYGSYNTAVRQAVIDAGFTAARSVNEGYNTGSVDRYGLLHREVNLGTSVADVRRWIDEAARTGTWLILTFHQVDYSGNAYATTPEIFRQIVDMVSASSLTPVTMAGGVSRAFGAV